MKTERIVYTPEVILPTRKPANNNVPQKIQHSTKNAALLSAALLALAANAKAEISVDCGNYYKNRDVQISEYQRSNCKNTDDTKEDKPTLFFDILALLVLAGVGYKLCIANDPDLEPPKPSDWDD